MVVNFNLTEGEDNSKYEEFVKLYNDYSVDVTKIKKKLGNSNTYAKFRKMALKNGDIKQRPFNLNHNTHFKYYHFDKKMQKYRVHKVKNGKYMSFGFYDTEEEAKCKVEELKKVNWDINKIHKNEK